MILDGISRETAFRHSLLRGVGVVEFWLSNRRSRSRAVSIVSTNSVLIDLSVSIIISYM